MRITACLGFLFVACTGGGPDGVQGPPDLGPGSDYTAEQAAAARAACMFGPGTAPGLSLAKDAPRGPEIPIDNVIVVMMENRSFDHILGALPAVGVKDVDVAPADAANPDANGNPVKRFHMTDYCFDDTNHEWQGTHDEYDDGKIDGFVKANQGGVGDPTGARAMGYYDNTDLPYLYALATTFATCDRYFCSVLGPTFPNREYLYAGTSFGYTYNVLIQTKKPTIFTALTDAGIPWHGYSEKYPGSAIFVANYTASLDSYEKMDRFFDAAKNGTLDPVVFLDADLTDGQGPARDDDHPPGDPQEGDRYLESVVNAVMSGPQWQHSAIFITWDEHGGLYDHVAPPPACAPDDIMPMDEKGPVAGDFARYGFRVPLIVVSPYAKAGFVSHVVHDHTSIIRFIETRFLVGALTKRDANADPLLEMFDFSHPRSDVPKLPPAPLDQAKLDACTMKFAPTDGGT